MDHIGIIALILGTPITALLVSPSLELHLETLPLARLT